jgi:hypothetical protein
MALGGDIWQAWIGCDTPTRIWESTLASNGTTFGSAFEQRN